MPAAKALSGLVPVKGTLYAVGGILQNSYATRELMSYNIERDTWTMLPQMKEVRYDPGKQKRKNPLVMNSKNRKFLCSNEILKLPKTFLSVSKGLILYFVNSLVKLSKQTKKWGGFSLNILGVTTIGNKIYVLSGHNGENSFFSSIEVYDTETTRWSELPILTLPYGRCRFTCVAMDTKQA